MLQCLQTHHITIKMKSFIFLSPFFSYKASYCIDLLLQQHGSGHVNTAASNLSGSSTCYLIEVHFCGNTLYCWFDKRVVSNKALLQLTAFHRYKNATQRSDGIYQILSHNLTLY
jgi:hypothetical protein